MFDSVSFVNLCNLLCIYLLLYLINILQKIVKHVHVEKLQVQTVSQYINFSESTQCFLARSLVNETVMLVETQCYPYIEIGVCLNEIVALIALNRQCGEV